MASIHRIVFAVAIGGSMAPSCKLWSRAESTDGVEAQAQTQRPRHSREAMALIHSVKPWPNPVGEDDYTREDWARLLDVAGLLQRTNPFDLDAAFSDYILHYDTAWEDGVIVSDEWSKPLLLLRVMYDVPLTDQPIGDSENDPCASILFNGFKYYWDDPDEDRDVLLADPIRWTDGGPRFTARNGGYMGELYDAYKESVCFRRHFQFRDLEKYRKLFAE